jgi:uncharacterized protein YecE (DUF72 family)
LTEYAEEFKTVCVDAAYYTFPSKKYLEGLMAQVPADFRFGFKVTDQIAIEKFPNLPRFGERAGNLNDHILNARLFEDAFLKTCEPFRSQIGRLMFEFSRFHSTTTNMAATSLQTWTSFWAPCPMAGPTPSK